MNKYFDTIVIGTGCAGYNACDWLYDLGHRNIAIVTEGVNMGTSRNTGSDKQTYYKLSLSGDDGDSVFKMAQTLFDGGSVHGDTALVEAACSVRSFIKLANLGVPFPTNEYGEYVGYKTDHDPRQRATSCGPLTSKLMTKALERSVNSKEIPIIDNTQIIKLLVDGSIYGVLALDITTGESYIINCKNVILATGGPAGVYHNSVYPISQTGATGLALDVGAKAINLTEWQYGTASTDFRWNVSGTYQQVLPRYISIDKNGVEKEFLFDDLSAGEALDMVFLKGYQWPFDTKKISASSRIDMLVDKQVKLGNDVYLDFRSNSFGLIDGFNVLGDEAYQYLKNSNALFGTPIERLAHMNNKAIELYNSNGIDLYTTPLKIAVCAQHCNGGIDVDINWESSIKGLYVVGEAAGTFGVYRPGGSALNSTQVGSMRAAYSIAYNLSKKEINDTKQDDSLFNITYANTSNVDENLIHRQKQMSKYAAHIRDEEKLIKLYNEFKLTKESFFIDNQIKSVTELAKLYKSYDILTTQIAVLSSMILSANIIGTRGSALVVSKPLDESNNNTFLDKIVYTIQEDTNFISQLEDVRPIPNTDSWFENVWNNYNKTFKC